MHVTYAVCKKRAGKFPAFSRLTDLTKITEKLKITFGHIRANISPPKLKCILLASVHLNLRFTALRDCNRKLLRAIVSQSIFHFSTHKGQIKHYNSKILTLQNH